MEHEICKGCKWNNYPDCYGTIMEDGNYMNIENLKPGFQCGQKESQSTKDFSYRPKTLKEELDELKARVSELEKRG